MEAIGLNQSQLARIVDLKQPSIGRLITGQTRESGKLLELARALQTTPEYLTGETDDPEVSSGQFHAPRREFRPTPLDAEAAALAAHGLVAIKEIDLTLGAGGTYIDDGAIAEKHRWLARDWLREFTDAPPEMLVVIRVRGDSMKPTLLDGAIGIVDLRRKRINEQDEVWAIAVADIGMVKRIWANPDGSYKIKSDNPNVSPETAHDDEMYVIGRVVASIGKH
jgi:phage repressor protein C with HTH and peptisase S24 domain